MILGILAILIFFISNIRQSNRQKRENDELYWESELKRKEEVSVNTFNNNKASLVKIKDSFYLMDVPEKINDNSSILVRYKNNKLIVDSGNNSHLLEKKLSDNQELILQLKELEKYINIIEISKKESIVTIKFESEQEDLTSINYSKKNPGVGREVDKNWFIIVLPPI